MITIAGSKEIRMSGILNDIAAKFSSYYWLIPAC